MRRGPDGRRDPATILIVVFAILVPAIFLALAVVLAAAVVTVPG